jgi:hypothetical protein
LEDLNVDRTMILSRNLQGVDCTDLALVRDKQQSVANATINQCVS